MTVKESGEIVYQPKPRHVCKPLMDKIEARGTLASVWYDTVPPVGTVWRCECGRLWEVLASPFKNRLGQRWVPAGMWTQLRIWWRLR